MIAARLEFFDKVDFRVSKFIEEMVAREDLVRWSNSPDGKLLGDTTGQVSKGLGSACWDLIIGVIP